MARPRIFISSTFYDLRQVRADLDFFIEQLGYEPVRNEEGDIPYGKEDQLEAYCYREINNIDILICIIGGRYGTESKKGKGSITQLELKEAIGSNKQVYIFIEKNVLAEFETYLINKNSDIKYRYVDDTRIYEFIEEIRLLSTNNAIKGFETAAEITRFLKEQFAGLFQRFLEQQTRTKEIALIKGLENTAQTLNKLVNFLSSENEDQKDEINKILMINHPLIEIVKKHLEIPYNFYIEGVDDLKALMTARGFSVDTMLPWEDENDPFSWVKESNRKLYNLSISKSLFDGEGKLKFVKRSEWNDSLVQFNVVEREQKNDDLPF